MERLKLGVIGAGPIVEKKHLPALAEVPEIEVVALCRRQRDALQRIADRFRVPSCYTDYRELLARDDIDALLVATGPEAQSGIAIDAAAAGKHLFLEKPMAESSSRAREMADVIAAAGVRCHIGFNKRFYYGYRRAWQLVREGALGELSGIAARFWFLPGRRDAMLHNGIHFLDLAAFFMGPVAEVFATRCAVPAVSPHGSLPETVSLALTFERGGVGSLMLSSLGAWDYPNEHVDLIGSDHNVISVENGRQLRLQRKGEGHPTELYENTLSVHWWSGNDEQGFAPQLRAFAQDVTGTGGLDNDLTTISARPLDGVRALELVEAIQSAAVNTAALATRSAP